MSYKTACTESSTTSREANLRAAFFAWLWAFSLAGCAAVMPRSTVTQRRLEAAQPEPSATPGEQARIALVIGNGAYSAGPLRNPPNDAEAVAETLRSVGFEVEVHINADRQQMKRAIVDFGKRLEDARGAGLFYFSGHGLQMAGRNYVVPIDATLEREEYVELEAVAADDVLLAMNAAGNPVNLIVLDACRNNPFARSFRSPARGLAFMSAPSGTLIAYATSPGSVASDGKGRLGVFTGALLEHVDDRGLSIEQVLKRSGEAVEDETRGAQVPWFASSLRGEFVFEPAAGPDAQELYKLAELAWQRDDFATMVEPLRLALASENFPLSAEQRTRAKLLLSDSERVVASYKLVPDPATASVQVDGSPVLLVDGKLLLNPGKHTIKVHQAGYSTVEREVTAVSGEKAELLASLERMRSPHTARQRWAAWGTIGAGGALLATSLITGVLSNRSESRLIDRCGTDRTCPDDLDFDWRATRDRGRRLALSTDLTLGLGLASAALGTFFYFRYFPGGERYQHVSLACATRGCSASLRVPY